MPRMPLHRMPLRSPMVALSLIAAACLTPAAAAQGLPPILEWEPSTLWRIGSLDEDRHRLAQTLDGASTGGFLLRSTADLDAASDGRSDFRLLAPSLETVWNSDLPFSMNDGALWAGRGLNVRLSGGLAFRTGRLRVVLAPEVVHEQNRSFQTVVFRDARSRSSFAHPFHPLPESIDQPLRFGDESRTRLDPGQSSITLDLGPAVVGFATENLWWGPGVRNAIVLSDNAPGFPHLSLATRAPVATPLGTVEAKWILGRLSESDFFDDDPSNDHRSLNAVAVTLSPAFARDLTLGFARSVFAPLEDDEIGFGAAADAFRSVGRPQSDSSVEPSSGPDQIFSLFGRWVAPTAGFETWGEWARFEQPASLRDFLEHPDHSQGWTLGLQWARPIGAPVLPDSAALAGGAPLVRVQAEVTNVEPASTFRVRPPFSSYTSRVVPHGYTHRGQVLGAAIGPAASSQWLAVDHLRPGWSIGGFWGRIRADNNVRLTDVVPPPRDEDVSMFWGLRGHADVSGFRAEVELTTGIRINYLFQSGRGSGGGTQARDGIDIANERVSVTVSRAAGW